MTKIFKASSTIWTLLLAAALAVICSLGAIAPFGKALNLVEPAYATEAQLNHVTDAAGILYANEVSSLEAQAQAIEDDYGFGVYIVIVDDYRDFSQASVFDAAMNIYTEYTLGVGPGSDGLMLLMSMNDRDYSLITYGDFGNYAFNDDARIAMTDYFLDDFSSDLWYEGFVDYLAIADLYLEAATNGAPYTTSNIVMTDDELMMNIGLRVLFIIAFPLVVALIVVAALSSKMKSVAPATRAAEYALGGMRLTGKDDSYSHTTRIVTKIQTQSSPSTSHHGGFGGTSGKF